MELPLHGPDDAGVRPVELRVLAFLHSQLRLVGREERHQVGVLQDLDITVHRRPRHAGVAGESGRVHHLAMEERGDR